MFHFHRWSDWSITEKGKVVDRWKEQKGSYIIQERFCIKCGKTQINTNATLILDQSNHELLPQTTLRAPAPFKKTADL